MTTPPSTTFTNAELSVLDNWVYDYNPSTPTQPPSLGQGLVVLAHSDAVAGNLSVAVAKLVDGVDPSQFSNPKDIPPEDIESIAIVNRGTQFSAGGTTALSDLLDDASVIHGTSDMTRLQAAAQFSDDVISQYQAGDNISVVEAGQSLGGATADYVVAYEIAKHGAGSSYQVGAVTEAALSASAVIASDFPSVDPTTLPTINYVHDTDYVVGPDGLFPGVEASGWQIGTSVTISGPPPDFFLGINSHDPSSFFGNFLSPQQQNLVERQSLGQGTFATSSRDGITALLLATGVGTDQLYTPGSLATHYSYDSSTGISTISVTDSHGTTVAISGSLDVNGNLTNSEINRTTTTSDGTVIQEELKALPGGGFEQIQAPVITLPLSATLPTITDVASTLGSSIISQIIQLELGGNVPLSLTLQALSQTTFLNGAEAIQGEGGFASFDQFGTGFGLNLAAGFGGYLGSEVGAELARDLGINSQVGAIAGSVVLGTATEDLATTVANQVFNAGIGTAGTFGGQVVLSAEDAFASFAGSELGQALVDGKPIGASVGSSVGGAVGVLFADTIAETAGEILGSVIPGIGTLLGAFIGSFLGDLIGGLFGPSPPNPQSLAAITLGSDGKFHVTGYFTDHTSNLIGAGLGSAVASDENNILAEIGGVISNVTGANAVAEQRVGLSTNHLVPDDFGQAGGASSYFAPGNEEDRKSVV